MIMQEVVYQEKELELVKKYEALPNEKKDKAYWEDKELSKLKSRIKKYYIRVQDNRCCYCNQKILSENNLNWDLEHIVCRAQRPDFMFEPKNLAVSCHDCNIAKSDENVLTSKLLKKYPLSSDKYIILHPHFDKFSDHIDVDRDGYTYRGITVKGKKTIYTCDLLRFAQKYIDWPNKISDKRFEEKVGRAFNDDTNLNILLDEIKKLRADLDKK